MTSISDFFDKFEYKNFDQHYPQVLTFFQRSFTEEEIKEQGLRHFAFDIYDHLANSLEDVERVEEVQDVLRVHQKEIYQEVSGYFLRDNIRQALYKNDQNKLKKAVAEFTENPIRHYDYMEQQARGVLFYGHQDILEQWAEDVYETVKSSDELLGGAEDEWVTRWMYIQIEKLYVNQHLSDADIAEFKENVLLYGFNLSDTYIENLQYCLDKDNYTIPPPEAFEQDQEAYLMNLRFFFLRYAYQRKIPFVTANHLWNLLWEYWQEYDEGDTRNSFFSIEGRAFENFLHRQAGMVMDYRHQQFALLYGSAYIYDFLLEKEVITQDVFDHFAAIHRIVRLNEIRQNELKLWQYTFVHQWTKPTLISAEEFTAEREVFHAQHGKKKRDPAFAEKYAVDFPSHLFAPKPKSYWEQMQERKSPQATVPIRTGKKYGRNEIVTVKYKDGALKKSKYKRLQRDIEAGKCEIVK